MQPITPFLWFDSQAEEAAEYYVSVFDDSEIREISRYPENTPGPAGSVMTVQFVLKGQEFTALNGGPDHNFTVAVSFLVSCKDQEEVDWYWRKLTEDGGEEGQCGWLKDRFGLSWQIVPDVLPKLLEDPDPERSQRVMSAMLEMKKLDIDELEQAAA